MLKFRTKVCHGLLMLLGATFFLVCGSHSRAHAAAKKTDFSEEYKKLKQDAENADTTADMKIGAQKLWAFCGEQSKATIDQYAKTKVLKAEAEAVQKKWNDYIAAMQKLRTTAITATSRGTFSGFEQQMADNEECYTFVNNLRWLFGVNGPPGEVTK